MAVGVAVVVVAVITMHLAGVFLPLSSCSVVLVVVAVVVVVGARH